MATDEAQNNITNQIYYEPYIPTYQSHHDNIKGEK